MTVALTGLIQTGPFGAGRPGVGLQCAGRLGAGLLGAGLLGACLLILLCSGCAGRRVALHMGHGARLPISDMGELARGRACVQRFEYRRGTRQFNFNGHAELERQRLALVGLTPLGSRGFAASYERGVFRYEHLPFYRLPLEARELLAAYQLIFLSERDLQPSLERAGLHLIESTDAAPGRELWSDKRLLARVRYSHEDRWRGSAVLEVPARGYQLRVITKIVEDLAPME